MNNRRITRGETTSRLLTHHRWMQHRLLRSLPCWSSGVVILLAFCLVTACGSSNGGTLSSTSTSGQSHTAQASPPTTAKVGIDPCSLITNAQAGRVLGAQVTGSPGEALPQCEYQDVAHSSQILVKVGTSQDAPGYYQLLRSLSSTPINISGIGDAAFYSDGMSGNLYTFVLGPSIAVLTGKAVFNIALTDSALNDAATRAASVQLAHDAESVVTATLPTLSAPHPDPCVLVTKTDVSQRFGGIQVQTVDGLSSGGAVTCTYSTPSPRDSAFTAVATYTTAGEAKNFFESTKPPAAKDISGIGDAAFFDALGTLEVLKGQTVLSVTGSGPDTSSAEASEEQLAHIAIGRL
jgi:hypothetical protein